MKKIIFSLLIILSLFLLTGCIENKNPDKEPDTGDKGKTDNPDDGEEDMDKDPVDLTIFTINDFHGVVFEKGDYAGLSKIGNFICNNYDDNVILLSAGDMFQGSAVSSMTRGRVVVDWMNYLEFDAMTIGNHEFDWSIQEVLKYSDGNEENGEANFPILCANCKDKSTGKLASWCVPYATFERMGVKIGVIGVIGQDEESDILETYVEMYDFTDEVTAIKKYTKVLRDEEKCDLVIVSAHCDTTYFNDTLASLKGNERIDVIINGHTHQAYYGYVKHADGTDIPYVQSGCYGTYVGRIDLTYNFKEKKVTYAKVENLKVLDYVTEGNQDIDDLMVRYQDYIDLANSELGYSNSYIDRSTMGVWIADNMAKAYNCDIGIINIGGVRSNGFPIYENQMIKYDSIFQILPFENTLQIVTVSGSILRDLFNNYSDSLFFSSNVDATSKRVNGSRIDDAELYTIITVDYLYAKSYYPFQRGYDHIDTAVLVRELTVDAVKENVKENGKFDIRK